MRLVADEVVEYTVEGAIARVTMNGPEYGNAQNSAMTYALDDAFYRAAADDDVAVVVLAGAGRRFSAGMTSARRAAISTPRSAGVPGCGGTTSARPAVSPGTRANRRSTWACADAGGSCPRR